MDKVRFPPMSGRPEMKEDDKRLLPSRTHLVLSHPGPVMLWKANRRCNLACAYCFAPVSERVREDPLCGRYPVEEIARRFDETGMSWGIFMTGGEPFLYPRFLVLCRELVRKHFLALNTNLSTPRALRFADEIDPARILVINAALHIEELERIGGFDRFLDRVRAFQDRGFPIGVEYVFYPPLVGRIDRDLRMLGEAGIKDVRIKAYRGIYRSRVYPRAYSALERAYFKRYADHGGSDFIENKYGFFGRRCRAGKDFLFMDIDGTVRRCPGSTASCGNFLDGNFFIDSKPRPCPFPRCFSPMFSVELAGGPRTTYPALFKECFREWPRFLLSTKRMKTVINTLIARR
jgi:MoaA/NifB/PqqE/SkfB family radical SAM enzyme